MGHHHSFLFILTTQLIYYLLHQLLLPNVMLLFAWNIISTLTYIIFTPFSMRAYLLSPKNIYAILLHQSVASFRFVARLHHIMLSKTVCFKRRYYLQ